jgi:selenide,water dikinase
VHIDVRRLAEFAGARYYRDEVIGIDRAARKVICRARPPVAYDALSINIGSTPKLGVPGADAHAVPVKPIRQFNQRWQALLQRVRNHAGVTTVAVVGAGAGGVELALSMQYRLRRELTEQGRNPDELRMHLLTAGPRILPTHNAAVRRRFEQVLAQRGVELHVDAEVVRVEQGRMETRAGKSVQADEIVWVTQAGGAAWLADTGLALDAAGFIRVRETLQTETDPLIFAAGDCTAWPRSSAGKGRRLRRAHGAAAGRKPAPSAARPAVAGLSTAAALAGVDQHWRQTCHRLARRVLRARRLGLALEGLDRPPLHAAFFRVSGDV